MTLNYDFSQKNSKIGVQIRFTGHSSESQFGLFSSLK